MASRDIPARVQLWHDKKKERNIKRFNNFRILKQTFLIVCEGANTEPDYFNEFKLSSAKVEAVGTGYNTVTLVNQAIELRRIHQTKGNKFDQYWVVFDKDGFSAEDFNNAIFIARANGFRVAYSNQAFEYWFLLHFNLYQGQIHRDTYSTFLTDLLGFKYVKEGNVSSIMFNALLSKQQTAIDNASLIYGTFDPLHPSPASEESTTTVHELVIELNKFK